jgi:hypothetical protein
MCLGNKDVMGGAPGNEPAYQEVFDQAMARNVNLQDTTIQIFNRTASGQITSPEDIAGLVSFLVSPAAKNITGMLLDVCSKGILTVDCVHRTKHIYRWRIDHELIPRADPRQLLLPNYCT